MKTQSWPQDRLVSHWKFAVIAFGAVLIFSEPGQAYDQINVLVTMTTDSTVYKSPSSKSKALADVEKETVLLARKISAKRLWIMVEDEDGNAGWVPTHRTNFRDLVDQQKKLKKLEEQERLDDEQQRTRVVKEQAVVENRKNAVKEIRHYLSALGRRAFTDPNGDWSYGPSYRIMLPAIFLKHGNEIQMNRIGFELAFLKAEEKFSVPLRLKWIGQNENSWIGTGPDLGVFYARLPNDSKWSGSMGYSVGINPPASGFSVLLRAGGEFFSKNRLSLELSTGWVF